MMVKSINYSKIRREESIELAWVWGEQSKTVKINKSFLYLFWTNRWACLDILDKESRQRLIRHSSFPVRHMLCITNTTLLNSETLNWIMSFEIPAHFQMWHIKLLSSEANGSEHMYIQDGHLRCSVLYCTAHASSDKKKSVGNKFFFLFLSGQP